MPTERLSTESEIFDASSLDATTQMKYVLGVFDLGKDKEKNEERRGIFMDLVTKYQELSGKKEKNTKKIIYGSDTEREIVHNQIVDTIIKMSLSVGLSQNQRRVTEYLATDRMRVEEMIGGYFRQNKPVTIDTPSEYLKTKEQLDYLSGKTGPEEE